MRFLCKFMIICFILLLIHDFLTALMYNKVDEKLTVKNKTIRLQQKRIRNLEDELSHYIGIENIRVAEAFNKRMEEEEKDV